MHYSAYFYYSVLRIWQIVQQCNCTLELRLMQYQLGVELRIELWFMQYVNSLHYNHISIA